MLTDRSSLFEARTQERPRGEVLKFSEQPPKDTLPPHSLIMCVCQSSINSVELYGIVCGVLSGRIKPEDFEHIREKALNTNGFVSLLEYCRDLSSNSSVKK
jgi:hypothetical protein